MTGKKTEKEKELRDSETRYRRLFESAKDGILILDAETGMVDDVNPFLVELLGFSHEEFLGKKIWDLGFYKDSFLNQDRFLELQQQKYVCYENLPLETADGRKISVEFVSNVYLVDHHKVIQCNIRDITGRKRAEVELRDSESRFRMIAERISDVVLILDKEGLPVYVSPSIRTVMGIEPDEFLEKTNDRSGLTAENRQKIEEAMARDRAGFPSKPIELTFPHKDGRLIDVESMGAPIFENGVFQGVQVTMHDITERKRAEVVLRESETKYRTLIETSPDGIIMADTETRVLYANQEAVRIMGYESPEQMIGKMANDFLAADIHEPSADRIGSLMERSALRNVELPSRRRDGSVFPAEYSVSPLLNDVGLPVGVFVLVRDITDKKRTEEIMRQDHDTQKAIYSIVQYAMKKKSLQDILTFALERILSISWLAFDSQGAIFLAEEPDTLVMNAHANLSETIRKSCARIPFGRCLCGRAAQTQKTEFADRIDRRHEITYPGIQPHGHYCVPIISDGKTLGVINIYVRDGSPSRERDDQFLQVIAVALAGIIERRSVEEALRKSEETYRLIADNMADTVSVVDMASLRFIYVSPSIVRLRGFTIDESMAQTLDQAIAPESMQLAMETLKEEMELEASGTADSKRTRIMDLEEYRKDGSTIWVSNSMSFLRNKEGRPTDILIVSRDITELKQAAEEMKKEQTLNKAIIESIPGAFYMLDETGQYVRWNAYQRDEIIGKPNDLVGSTNALETIHPNDRVLIQSKIENVLANGVEETVEGRVLLRGGPAFRWLLMTGRRMLIDGRPFLIGTGTDITDRKRAEEEKSQLEIQLRQSQKMEAIGTLAGGVAHDFNNLLTAILGYSEIMQASLDKNDPIYKDAEEINKAGQSAAALTKQLLAFSRKQIIATKVLNLNDIVEHSKKMLSRLIGEDIDLVFVDTPDLWSTKADPAQIDQILVNLVVNSRYAMPDGGKLTIETQNVSLDEEYCKNHIGTLPGDFIILAVSDNGVGMDKETQTRIFEPFFTTKAKNKGTGLGLSTVYGIVKQHGGFISVYSEPGEGTTFKIYLPRVIEEAEVIEKKTASVSIPGSETILLVEDQDMVRRLAKRILEQNGYRVLEADDGGDAYLKCEKYVGEIDLLLTDVIMPNLNGKELYKRIAKMKPGIRVLYMSGYTDDAIARHGVLEPGTMFLNKPFKANDLLLKVRETLDAAPSDNESTPKNDESAQ